MTYVLGSENPVTFTSILSLLNVESALMAYNWGLGDYGASVEGTDFGGAVNAGGITGRVNPSPCATYDPDLAFGVCPTYGTGPGALVLDAQTSENCAAYNISSGDGPDTRYNVCDQAYETDASTGWIFGDSACPDDGFCGLRFGFYVEVCTTDWRDV